jgi:hypothetical protein
MQDLEKAQLAELLRESNLLLRSIERQSRPIKPSELSQEDFNEAAAHKVREHSLADVVAVVAESKGMNIDTYIQQDLKKGRSEDKARRLGFNGKSVNSILGVRE